MKAARAVEGSGPVARACIRPPAAPGTGFILIHA